MSDMLPLAKEPTRVFMRASLSLLVLANVAMANAAYSVTVKGQGTGDSGLCTGKTCRVVEGCDAANGSGGGVTRDACKAACDGGATIATQIARNSQLEVLFWVNLALCQIIISPYYYYGCMNRSSQ